MIYISRPTRTRTWELPRRGGLASPVLLLALPVRGREGGPPVPLPVQVGPLAGGAGRTAEDGGAGLATLFNTYTLDESAIHGFFQRLPGRI